MSRPSHSRESPLVKTIPRLTKIFTKSSPLWPFAAFPLVVFLPRRNSSEDAPQFELTSVANITPVVIAVARLSMHVFQPYVVAGLFALAGLG